jgi:hypothetical protein
MNLMLCPNPLNHVQLTMKRGFLWCPTFRKLVHLTLDCSFVNDDFYGLIVLLQNSPNLKKLTLKLGKVCALRHIMGYSVHVYACIVKINPISFYC